MIIQDGAVGLHHALGAEQPHVLGGLLQGGPLDAVGGLHADPLQAKSAALHGGAAAVESLRAQLALAPSQMTPARSEVMFMMAPGDVVQAAAQR